MLIYSVLLWKMMLYMDLSQDGEDNYERTA